MTNNLLTWQIGSDGYVWSEAIDSDDLNVSEDKLFAIVYDNNGFMLVPSNSVTTTITATPNSPASGNSGAPASYLTSTERASAINSARWTMFKYTGADKCGVTIIPNASLTSFEEDGAVAGSTYTFESAVWYTYSSINDNVIVVTPSNSNVADVVWNNSNYTTTVTVKNFGKLSFDVNIWRVSSGAPQTLYGARYTYNAIPKEGTYYLQNKYSQKYAYVDSPSATDGTTVQQWNFHAGFPERWQVEYVNNSGGYVRLKSLFSEKYLSVDPNDSTKIKQYSSPGDNGLWRFELLDDYAVKIICKASESSGKVLAVPLNSTENGVDLTQRTYTDNSDYSDEWYMLNINGSEVFLLGIEDEGHDHYSALGKIMTPLTQLGYKDFNYTITSNIDFTDVLQNMAKSRVYVSRSHGGVGDRAPYIVLKNSSLGSITSADTLGSYDIYNFDTDIRAVDLSNCDIMLFIGCNTGTHEEHSLPHAAVAAGAETAIGFKESINCNTANEWTQYFFYAYWYFSEYITVEQAAEAASNYCGNCNGVDKDNSLVVVTN